jgi:hypothetical protein
MIFVIALIEILSNQFFRRNLRLCIDRIATAPAAFIGVAEFRLSSRTRYNS